MFLLLRARQACDASQACGMFDPSDLDRRSSNTSLRETVLRGLPEQGSASFLPTSPSTGGKEVSEGNLPLSDSPAATVIDDTRPAEGNPLRLRPLVEDGVCFDVARRLHLIEPLLLRA